MIPAEIHLLPPPKHHARGLALIILVLAPFAFGALAVALGQDANWDLRNYHWYNAYAFLNSRYDMDLLPSQTPWFYNPLLDVPFYLLATHVPSVVAGFMLGCAQGLNFILLFMIAHVSLRIANPRSKIFICAGLAALGMLGGGGIAQIGTTFGDNITSLGIFLSMLLVIRHIDLLIALPLRPAFLRMLLFGIPAGLMMGLKLPAVIFCMGLCFALLGAGGPWARRLMLSFAFGCGVLLGVAIAYGHWAWHLQTHFGSPTFPYFNDIFQSSFEPLVSDRDTKYIPSGAHDILLFPFLFADSPFRVGEIPWRDWRIPILYALLPVAVLLRLFFGRARLRADAIARPFALRYLLWTAVIAYVGWLRMFAIYRYALPLEMLAPLLIVFATDLLPLRLSARSLLAGFMLLVVAGSIQPGNWTRRNAWLDRFVEAEIPPLGETLDLMILMAGYEPYSHLVTQFPPEIPFLRIQSNFSNPGKNAKIDDIIRARLEAHKGRFLMLIPPWQHDVARDAMRPFGLALASEPCQTVLDRLYHDQPMDLCRIVTVR